MAQPPYPPQPPYGPPPGYPPPGYGPPQPGPPYGMPYPPRKKGMPGWVIAVLAILGFVVMFGGVLAVLAISGMRRYLANAKTAEARSSLAVIARDASMAFEREQTTRSGATVHRLCASASRSVPDSVVQVSGKKYVSSAADWQVDAPRHAGFACLGFSYASPQYYMYTYRAHGDGFEATAVGDLNGDGKTSLFKISGTVTGAGTVAIDPQIFERDPEE